MGDQIAVFVVEDHETVRDTVCQLLRRSPGLRLCGEAESAEAALAQFPDCCPEVVLVDLSLPGMDGLALIQHLHENQPEVVTLAVSAYLESIYALQTLEAGARGYIMKDELIGVVEAIYHVYNGGLHVSDRVRAKLGNR